MYYISGIQLYGQETYYCMLLITVKIDKILNGSPKPTRNSAGCITSRWLRTKAWA